MQITTKKSQTTLLSNIAFTILLLFFFSAAISAQENAVAQNTNAQPVKAEKAAAVLQPAFTNYREIKVGMTADEVKDHLGKPKMEDKEGLYYKLSDDESAQIILDGDKKVHTISIIYSGEDAKAPKFEDVFGSSVAAEAAENGRVYKLIRYPEAGYWVAYSSTGGDKPTVTVTMQKMLDIFIKKNNAQ